MNEATNVAVSSTKERILDAAERLIAANGFDATSLRAITTEADVNLAAVNYHFRSKDALMKALIARRIGPVNDKRLAMLDAIEAAAGDGPLPLGPVIDAFIRPVLEIRNRARMFAPILGRLFSENAEFVTEFFNEHLAVVAQRFTDAFSRAVPGLPRREVYWRAHFLIGAMAHNMALGNMLNVFSGGLCNADEVEGTVKRMVYLFTAVFEAPHVEIENA